jgi:hypothetical protein
MTNYPTEGQYTQIQEYAGKYFDVEDCPILPDIADLSRDDAVVNSENTGRQSSLFGMVNRCEERRRAWFKENASGLFEEFCWQRSIIPELRDLSVYVGMDLNERMVSYGSRVFNFALPFESEDRWDSITIPEDFAAQIWGLCEAIEPVEPNGGVKMMRVDALREPDGSISIMEINPNWVDNISALAGFQEVYETFGGQAGPIQSFCELMTQDEKGKKLPNRKILLAYCGDARGCKKDEMKGLSMRLKASGVFEDVELVALRDVRVNESGNVESKGAEYGYFYLNGSREMASRSIREQKALESVYTAAKASKVVAAPYQFEQLGDKSNLVEFSKRRPDLFTRTVFDREEIPGKAVVKNYRGESLRGIRMAEDGSVDSEDEDVVYQPFTPVISTPRVCVDMQRKAAQILDAPYEKINIWIMGDKVVGAIAAYDESPWISDAGYNYPLNINFSS